MVLFSCKYLFPFLPGQSLQIMHPWIYIDRVNFQFFNLYLWKFLHHLFIRWIRVFRYEFRNHFAREAWRGLRVAVYKIAEDGDKLAIVPVKSFQVKSVSLVSGALAHKTYRSTSCCPGKSFIYSSLYGPVAACGNFCPSIFKIHLQEHYQGNTKLPKDF